MLLSRVMDLLERRWLAAHSLDGPNEKQRDPTKRTSALSHI